jgi:putative phage-type endonuclease
MGIGSSDAPVIAGEVGSVIELWAEKSGLVEPSEPDAPTAELFEWGHRLEPVIADWYADTQGRPLRRVNQMIRHPEIPWAFASLDRVTTGEKRIVEIKTSRWGWEHGEPVPGRVQAQVQHQLWVSGYEVADVAVLTGGSQPRIYEITRDDNFIDDLVFLETEFWGWVTSGTRPPMDGSENARRVLGRLHPRNDGTLLSANDDLDRLALDWRAAKEVVAQAEAEEDTLANAIRAIIGDADGFEGSWGRITWKKNADSKRVDWPTVAHEVGLADPELLAATIAAHTTTVEGPRVLRPSWKEQPSDKRTDNA